MVAFKLLFILQCKIDKCAVSIYANSVYWFRVAHSLLASFFLADTEVSLAFKGHPSNLV